jgi:hypothetical protein
MQHPDARGECPSAQFKRLKLVSKEAPRVDE